MSPASYDFGKDVHAHLDPNGNPAFFGGPSKEFIVTNDGVLQSGEIEIAPQPSADGGHFKYLLDGCQGVSLLPGESCTFRIIFDPFSVGPKSITLVASASPGGTATAALTGTGT